jgi:threonine dehydratase
MARVDFGDIIQAQSELADVVGHTPLVLSRVLSVQTGSTVYLKTENTQRTGSFKIRGAYHKILSLSEAERGKGVIAASAGNHAQGVAISAAALGIKSTVVMPEGASLSKVVATRSYGAEVVLAGHTYDEALAHAKRLQAESGATFIHAFDDWKVMAGQGSLGLEVMRDLPTADVVLVPIGGGGLIAGVASAIKHDYPKVRIVGVQAAGAAACRESMRLGRVVSVGTINTIADGIAVKTPGELTFSVIKELVDDVVTVDDEEISRAILFLLERTKLLVEPAGAVGVAALMAKRVTYPGKNVVAILSGGNVDIHSVARYIEHGLTLAGRYIVISTHLRDEPGQLSLLLKVFTDHHVNVLDIQHFRAGYSLQLNQTEVHVTAETRDAAHAQEIMDALAASGFKPNHIS